MSIDVKAKLSPTGHYDARGLQKSFNNQAFWVWACYDAAHSQERTYVDCSEKEWDSAIRNIFDNNHEYIQLKVHKTSIDYWTRDFCGSFPDSDQEEDGVVGEEMGPGAPAGSAVKASDLRAGPVGFVKPASDAEQETTSPAVPDAADRPPSAKAGTKRCAVSEPAQMHMIKQTKAQQKGCDEETPVPRKLSDDDSNDDAPTASALAKKSAGSSTSRVNTPRAPRAARTSRTTKKRLLSTPDRP
ncbi:hypothetical protein Q5752_000030 [Cryptotrichosporon argae]